LADILAGEEQTHRHLAVGAHTQWRRAVDESRNNWRKHSQLQHVVEQCEGYQEHNYAKSPSPSLGLNLATAAAFCFGFYITSTTFASAELQEKRKRSSVEFWNE
jgi:hypothetical protein